MSFEVAAEAYDRFMGRYSRHLSAPFAELAGIGPGVRTLDVGCGPGALTAELVSRAGADAVTAVDPSASFVAAVRERQPGIAVEHAAAEQLPFPDASFDAALAQLVVHFMDDPVAGLGEMGRVTASGGVVAACVWDHAEGGRGPLSLFYRAAREVDQAAAPDEAPRPGIRRGHLGELFRAAGLREVDETVLEISVEHPSFEDWWEPFSLGVGPTAGFFAAIGPAAVDRLRERCRELLPPAPFLVEARAWAARGVAA